MNVTSAQKDKQDQREQNSERFVQPRTLHEFTELFAAALGVSPKQLQSGDGVPILEIMTAVPRSLRLEYLELRRQGYIHQKAVKLVNAMWDEIRK